MSRVTLTGEFERIGGGPATGTVRVTPSRSPIMDPQGRVVISGPQTFPLDKDGKLTVQIPASNDPDLGPPFTYTVEALLSHNPWKISKVWIPHGSSTVDLSEIGDYTPTPGVATRVVTIPADGTDGQVLVWDGAGFVWDFPPEGPRGPKGDSDAEQLVGAPRLTNLAHGITWTQSYSTIDSQAGGLVKFTSNTTGGNIRWSQAPASDASYYLSAEVKTTSDQVGFGSIPDAVYHSGSGDWERLTVKIDAPGGVYFMVRDRRTSGWDQIELRDPVLINLTAVFGAGREPTKEYMDALLAKHGNYIGGVDQFAVGDALQALTVAGPGMTLRRDTTVGTRVFLDHPGGSTMLHGDTGWREITTLENGWTGNISVRRVLDAIYVVGNDLSPTAATSTTIFTLPTGYAPRRRAPITVQLIGDKPLYGRIHTSQFIQADYTTSPTLARDLYGVYSTAQAWPTTLPGTPA